MSQTGALAETQADDDFNSGFTQDAPEAKVEPKPRIEPKAEAPKADPPAPKYRQITEDEFARFDGAISKMVTPEKVKDLVGGIMGGLEQRIVQKLQAGTPQGATVELPADVVSEMEAEFPELAVHVRKSLEKALKGVRGTGTAAASVDPEAMQTLVKAAAVEQAKLIETEALEDAHPQWREIVGVVDAEGKHDPENGYRKWLAKKDVAYQHRINATNSAAIIARSIDMFLADKEKALKTELKPAPQAAARRDRIQGALQPRGDGGQPAPSKTADDDFNEGFRSG